MSNVKMTVKIEIEPTETEVVSSDTPSYSSEGCFQLIVDGKYSMDIETKEDGLLQTSYPALCEALAESLEQESKKQALKKSLKWGNKYQVVKHDSEYLVEGEIGRFEFGTYDVTIDNLVVFKCINAFPLRTGIGRYQTCGFKEIALLH